MTKGKIAQEPTPIDLTYYEDEYLQSTSANRFLTYGDQVRVESQVNGKTIQKNLWEVANPGKKMGQDGFLSYEEAKGKTFIVPIALCNSPGTIGFQVNTHQDFQDLRYYLYTPIRVDRFAVFSCGYSPSVNKAPENFKISKEIYEDAITSLKEAQNTLSDELADALEENFGPPGPISESFGESLSASAALFASAFAQESTTAGMTMGIKAALLGTGISEPQNECNWDLDEELPDHCFEE